MNIKFILPSLIEADSPFWRPIKYSLFPPLGLATLAGFLDEDDQAEIVDQHVMELDLDDYPDVVAIEVYITNAYHAYKIADHYRARGVCVILGGLHVTSCPDEAAFHADAIFLGPAKESFPRFLQDYKDGMVDRRYVSKGRTIQGIPNIRRDLIDRNRYLVPNSLVVSRGCPHHCNFCYKDAFFEGGKGFYVQRVDEALEEISRLPGRHLYFLDDHLLADKRFARGMFEGMRGMNRIFQGAATVHSILHGDLIEKAAEAGLRSIFIGFESLESGNLVQSNKGHNLGKDYDRAIDRLHDLGIMINGSFVFGLDHDTPEVIDSTVAWAVEKGITTSTFHIATPYPGTKFYQDMVDADRMVTNNWDLFDTRHVTFEPIGMTAEELEEGYHRAYREFYSWPNIVEASLHHGTVKHQAKHFFYAGGWKKFEPLWGMMIQMKKLNLMTPLLEGILSKVTGGAEPKAKNRVEGTTELVRV